MSRNLLFEMGVEEIPASYILPALDTLAAGTVLWILLPEAQGRGVVGGVFVVAGEAHLARPADPDRLGEQHGEAPARHHADPGVGVEEFRAARDEDHVAGEGELEAGGRGRARPIADLEAQYAAGDRATPDGREWAALDAGEQSAVLDEHRLAYLSEAPVNWCPGLGTVLANEEVIDGKSERGGHPVQRLPLRQP